MRGRKTPAVAFVARLIYTTGRPDLLELLRRSPLTEAQAELVALYAAGASYKELAEKYRVTAQTVYNRKRKAYERLARYMAERP